MGNKLYAVIDIGSNSVRLMMSENLRTLYKKVNITHLAQGQSDGVLTDEAISRTANAVCEFVDYAKSQNADGIFIFATAAVRRAKNKNDFIDLVNARCQITVDVISGETEAELGALGALGGADGGVIDIGGASTEITVYENGGKAYSKSLYVGTVSLNDACGQNESRINSFIDGVIKDYGDIPKSNFKGIGGTATSISAVMQELEPYDPTKADGFVIEKGELVKLKDRVFNMTLKERIELKGLQAKRAPVFAGGVLILLKIMDYLKVDSIAVSESDNLEGYLKYKTTYEKKN